MKVLGIILVSTPFVALFIAAWIAGGLLIALVSYVLAFAIVAFIFAGMFLIDRERL